MSRTVILDEIFILKFLQFFNLVNSLILDWIIVHYRRWPTSELVIQKYKRTDKVFKFKSFFFQDREVGSPLELTSKHRMTFFNPN